MQRLRLVFQSASNRHKSSSKIYYLTNVSVDLRILSVAFSEHSISFCGCCGRWWKDAHTVSEAKYRAIADNYDQNNITGIEQRFADGAHSCPIPDRAVTMVHVNTHTEIAVSEAAKEACGRSVVRFR